MLLTLGIILGIVGLLMLIKPTVVWSITEQWKSNDATEPSGLYIWSIRFGGMTVTIISVLCFYAHSL